MAKIRSFGTKVFLNNIEVGGLTDINFTAGDITNVDTTCHSVADGFRVFVPGLKDGGSVEITGKYDYSDDGQVEWRAGGSDCEIIIIFTDGTGFVVDVILGNFSVTAPLADATEFTASAKITGPVAAYTAPPPAEP